MCARFQIILKSPFREFDGPLKLDVPGYPNITGKVGVTDKKWYNTSNDEGFSQNRSKLFLQNIL